MRHVRWDEVDATEQPASQLGSRDGRSGQLLEAVLVTANLHQAAKLAGIPWSSARRIYQDGAFQEELVKARQEAMDVALSHFRGLASKVVDLVEEAIERKDMRVALWAMDKLLGLHDADLEGRIRRLEESAGIR
jgi:molybdenum-dependent DNA-binding transcriptional regulator ModE